MSQFSSVDAVFNSVDDNVRMIRAGLELLVEPGSVFEVRVPKYTDVATGQQLTVSGLFDDLQVAANLIAQLDGQCSASGIFVTMNPVRPGPLVRVGNSLRYGGGSSTKDSDITRRRWLLLDLDPHRSAGTSSTNEELGHALKTGDQIVAWLAEHGVPEPLRVMSGNGLHLYVAVNLPTDDGGLVKRFLGVVHRRFSNAQVEVDTTVGNASRITKVPGTMARKGPAGVQDRPHRRARVLNPDYRRVEITREQLEAIVAKWPATGDSQPAQPARRVELTGLAGNLPLPVLQPIRNGCSFINKAFTEAATLSEPEWFAGISIVALCENGRELAHEMSRPYPRYSATETDRKVDRAAASKMPHTCDTIENSLHHAGCATCPHRGRIKSPIQLGRVELQRVEVDGQLRHVLARNDWGMAANAFLEDTRARGRLVYRDERFWRWNGSMYWELQDQEMSRDVRALLAAARYRGTERGESRLTAIPPNTFAIDQVISALRDFALVTAPGIDPMWLSDAANRPSPVDLIAFSNGLLNMRTRELIPATDELFVTSAHTWEYDPQAADPTEFLDFFSALFGGDQDSMDTVRMFMGYCLTTDISFQRALLLNGPPRSGKSTLLRVMEELVGRESTVSLAISTLGKNFGLQAVIGRRLGVFPDVHVGSFKGNSEAIEVIKKVTGGDRMTIDRKLISAWEGTLPLKLMFVANALPQLVDHSGGLSRRMLIVSTVERTGDDNTLLVDQLLTERQGIMRWAVTGYQMLLQRRRFSEPTRSQDLREHWEELAAPVKSFVQECLVRDPNGTISKGAMFEHYQQWCVDRTLTPPTAEQFAKDLRAAVPEIRTIQRRENGRARHWAGLEFRQPAGVDIMRLAGQAVA